MCRNLASLDFILPQHQSCKQNKVFICSHDSNCWKQLRECTALCSRGGGKQLEVKCILELKHLTGLKQSDDPTTILVSSWEVHAFILSESITKSEFHPVSGFNSDLMWTKRNSGVVLKLNPNVKDFRDVPLITFSVTMSVSWEMERTAEHLPCCEQQRGRKSHTHTHTHGEVNDLCAAIPDPNPSSSFVVFVRKSCWCPANAAATNTLMAHKSP